MQHPAARESPEWERLFRQTVVTVHRHRHRAPLRSRSSTGWRHGVARGTSRSRRSDAPDDRERPSVTVEQAVASSAGRPTAPIGRVRGDGSWSRRTTDTGATRAVLPTRPGDPQGPPGRRVSTRRRGVDDPAARGTRDGRTAPRKTARQAAWRGREPRGAWADRSEQMACQPSAARVSQVCVCNRGKGE
jgi:hypothetical protein